MKLAQETKNNSKPSFDGLISRIAPTPSGFLHAGNVYNFLLTYLFIRSLGGILHLRIDDYDLVRYRREFVENIFYVLEMLGIECDFGACGVSEFESKFSSKFRLSQYQEALNALKSKNVCYVCECSHSMENSFQNGIYKQICLHKNLNFKKDENAVRLHIPPDTKIQIDCRILESVLKIKQDKIIDLSQNLGDFIIWKKDDMPAYNLASLVDDERLGVNFLIRGEDLIECSAAQKYMANLLNFSFASSNFIHHSLLMDNGKKLSKSSKSSPVNLKDGAKIHYRFLASNLGLNPQKCETLSDLLENFKENLSRILAL